MKMPEINIKESTSPSTSSDITTQGRLILKYLQEKKDGARLQEIVQHIEHQAPLRQPDELSKNIELIVGSGATLGFLERKGSKFMCWMGKQACGFRRRRRKCRCRRKLRSSSRRRRHRRRRRPRRCRCGADLSKALV